MQKILFVFYKYMSGCILQNRYELQHFGDNIQTKKMFENFSQLISDVF